MKIVKYIFLLLFLIAIALVVFIATQEGRYNISKERVINVPRTTLYNYINDYRNWENIGILTDNDTTAVFGYTDITAGSGAKTTWKRNGSEGEITTIKAVANDSIIQKAVIDGQPSHVVWRFIETAGGTKLSVSMKGELSFTNKAYAVLKGGVKDKLEATLDAGLKNLDTFLVHELGTFDVDVKGLVTKTGTFYLKHTTTSAIADVAKKSSELLNKLIHFTETNNIATNGSPFTIFKNFDRQADRVDFSVSVPIKEEIFTMPGSEYEGAKLEAFQAVKVTLKGDYSHLKKAWDAGRKEIFSKSLQENTTGMYLEVYTKGIRQTKRPSEWVTDIYIPVGQPAVTPAESAIPAPPAAVNAPGAATRPANAATPVRTTNTTPRPATAQPRATSTATPSRTAGTSTAKPAGAATTRTTSTPANRPAGTSTTKPATATAQPARTVPARVEE